MKLRFLFAAVVGSAVLLSCNKSPNQPTGDYRLQATWPAHPDSLALFTNYTFSYQTGQDVFNSLYASTDHVGFLDTASSVTWNFTQKTGTVYFIKTGQCRFYLAGKTSDNRRFADSCIVTVRSPYGITGDSVIDVRDTAKIFLAPQPAPASMIPGIMVDWKVNGVSIRVIKVTDTFNFSNIITSTYSIIASLVDTARTNAAPIDTFPLKIGDYRLQATWPAHPDSLALFTNYTFSYQTGHDPFDSLYAYINPAGFINTSASVTWNLIQKTGTVYFIKTGQCRLYLAGTVSGGVTLRDSCLVTVRNSFIITGDTAIGVRDTAKIFLAPQPAPASMASGTMVEWKVNGVSTVAAVTDTLKFSDSVAGDYSIVASFVDTVHRDTARLDTFPLKIGDYRLQATWPAHPDSLALFTNYTFSYQTGLAQFDSLYAYTVPTGFIDTSASVIWNLTQKTGTVYFIKTGQCRFYLAGKTSDNRRFADSCIVTVRSPYGITGDTAVDVRDTAKLFLAPQPAPASMIPGIMVEWKVNGVSHVIGVTDTFNFSNSVSGAYSIVASFVDTVHRDTARLDTFPLKIRDYRLQATWPAHPDSLALFTNNTFSYQTGQDPFDSLYAYTLPGGFLNSAASVTWNLSAKTGTVYFIKAGQCLLYVAGKTSDYGTFRDSCLVTVRNPFGITGDTAVDVRDTAMLFLAPQPAPASMASGTMVEWKVNGVSHVIGVTDTFNFSNSVSGAYSIVASFVDTVHRDTARLDTFPLKIRDYRLQATWPAHPDSLALFTNYTFSYQTGLDPFDSLYATTDQKGYLNAAASVTWNHVQKTVTVYFIKTGQCRFYLTGTTSDGRRFADSCLVTVRNPFGITGDTLIGQNEMAKLFLAPRPDLASMASGTMAEWTVNGMLSTIIKVTDTFTYSNIMTGAYSIIASLVDTAHRDTARLDTSSLKIWHRIKTTSFGTGSGTISPANPLVSPGDNQAITITPSAGSVIAKLYKGASEVTVLTTCTWTTVTGPDSLRVMFFAVPAQSRPIPSQGVSFRMGSVHASLTFYGPSHLVTLTYGYFMDSAEVSQNDYFDLMSVAPSFFTGNVNRPVENMTWYDAVLYCNARSKRDGLDTVYRYTTVSGPRGNGVTALGGLTIDYTKIGYRLPTEAECEYALRAGSETEYYWGRGYPMATRDDTLATDTNAVWQHNSGGSTQTVASKKHNAWGLYDLIGNVAEFCNDWYAGYTSTWLTDPTGPASGTQRVQRGGAWLHIADHSFTSAGRFFQYPYDRANFIGFRAVLPAAK